MNAIIIDNISKKPHILNFCGEEYDLQLNAYVISKFKNFSEILNSIGKLDKMFILLAEMMNADTIARKLNRELLSSDYIATQIPLEKIGDVSMLVAEALGYEAPTEAENELDSALDSEGIKDPEKN